MITALVKLFQSIPALMTFVTSIGNAWNNWKESQHKRAIEKLKSAKTKEEMEKAINEVSRNP